MRVSADHDGKASGQFVVRSLRADAHRLLVEFHIAEIEGDNSTTYCVALDLKGRTARASIQDDLRFHSNCKEVGRFDDDDDDDSGFRNNMSVASLDYLFDETVPRRNIPRLADTDGSYSRDLPGSCGTRIEITGIRRLQFPQAVPEQHLLQITAIPKLPKAAKEGQCESSPHLAKTLVHSMTRIHLTLDL
jgi:hypothetical protein